ncbi:hypothetical protein DPMN_129921 [Dreissena polymorpha]|uniref:Uncharacterized protein n=2 Tax=Dreissena polymorpha TaxID=45954 RepID=A0A9D4JX45_DREPO|nr:hypothetical protein DPMN_129921 [Dreissena polymorpha]
MPCICNTEAEWGNLTNDEIIQILVKELTIDPSQTTVERSKRESRQDPRVSSANMGRLAIAVILIILAAVIIPDLITLWRALNRWRN